jgi:hypothetical protein
MVFQTNASGTFQEDHLYILHIYLVTVFGYCIFKVLEGRKIYNSYRNPARTQNLRPISLLPTPGKRFEKVVLKMVQSHVKVRDLLNASQSDFHARHRTTLHCMRRTDLVTLNFNSNISTAAVFMDVGKTFDTTLHLGLLCKLIN